MKEKISKLITVKSLVTILLTIVVCYLALKGKMNIEQIYLIVISFYFGTQHEKSDNK